jgi:RNA polymerase sigma-70 factor (ECF subfamily)
MQHNLATQDPADRQEQARLLREGDEAFFEAVIQEVRKIAYVLARRSYHSLERADMTSAALKRIWEKRDSYAPERGSLRQWMFAVARSAATDLLRSGQHAAGQLMSAADCDGVAWDRPEEHPQPSEMGQQLETILDAMSPLDRQIILEYHRTGGEGAWAADLAPTIGVAAGTIRVKRRRIEERVRQNFARRGYEVERARSG